MMSQAESVTTFNMESAEAKYSELLGEAVLDGKKMGGPTSAEEYKRMVGDVYDLMSQDKDPANRAIYNQKLADLKRVAKERGIAVAESAGGTSAGAVASSFGGGNGFANGGPGTISRQGKPKKIGNIPQKAKVTVGKGVY